MGGGERERVNDRERTKRRETETDSVARHLVLVLLVTECRGSTTAWRIRARQSASMSEKWLN
jgi:hypothetical protein